MEVTHIHKVALRPPFLMELELKNVTFSKRGKSKYPAKNLSKRENQQQTQTTYGIDAGTQTWATSVGGECPHNCATMPVVTWYFQLKLFKVSVQKLDPPFSSVSVVKSCNRTGDHPVTFTHQF